MSKQENIQNKRKRMKRRIISQVGNNVSANILPIVVKIVLLGMLDAMSLYGAFALLMQHKWVVLGLLLVGTGVINWIYWRSHGLAAKYLAPGIVLLLIFQLFAISLHHQVLLFLQLQVPQICNLLSYVQVSKYPHF